MGNKGSQDFATEIKNAQMLQNEGLDNSIIFCKICREKRLSRYYGQFQYNSSCVIDYNKCCYCSRMNKKFKFI